MKKNTIIFFTVEPGIAHITRSLSIAVELKRRGHRVVFAITKAKQEFINKAGIEVVDAPVSLEEGLPIAAIERWKDAEFILSLAKEDQKIIKRFSPDAVVVDFRASAVVASRSLGVPVAFVTGSAGLPYGCELPNPGYPPRLFKIASPLLKKIIWRAKLSFYEAMINAGRELGLKQDLDQFIQGLTYIVPEPEGYLKPLDSGLKVNRIGPLFWKGFESKAPAWLDNIKPDGRTIYLTFGGTGYDGQKLIDLSSALIKKGFRVIVSASNIASVSHFPKRKDLYVEKYLPGMKVSQKVDLIVCHGGYGTMMQAVLSGKPVVAVPFNPDQLLHSYRFQELGLGRCLVRLNPSVWLKPSWRAFSDMSKTISAKLVVGEAENIFRNIGKYHKSINAFKKTVFLNGPERAANVVENL